MLSLKIIASFTILLVACSDKELTTFYQLGNQENIKFNEQLEIDFVKSTLENVNQIAINSDRVFICHKNKCSIY
ncbi:hypothetical protein JFL43_10835 [Viridibacillus sp. YIM B01967]|uniref:Lipoprotein n=1 Tax=Viridibacillus soli TaxID=2798301 RepID=A0ABS1H7D8_9BACL|nr:hypothetical protein [Viridibacillus soli]